MRTIKHPKPLTGQLSKASAHVLNVLRDEPRPIARAQGYQAGSISGAVNPYPVESAEGFNWQAGYRDGSESNS